MQKSEIPCPRRLTPCPRPAASFEPCGWRWVLRLTIPPTETKRAAQIQHQAEQAALWKGYARLCRRHSVGFGSHPCPVARSAAQVAGPVSRGSAAASGRSAKVGAGQGALRLAASSAPSPSHVQNPSQVCMSTCRPIAASSAASSSVDAAALEPALDNSALPELRVAQTVLLQGAQPGGREVLHCAAAVRLPAGLAGGPPEACRQASSSREG